MLKIRIGFTLTNLCVRILVKGGNFMKIKKITSDTYKKTKWSAGETTQIAIFPENADFSKKDFIFRISSATVECEESDFTIFKDHNRYICPLEGEISLTHEEDSRKYNLKEYDFHEFDGAVNTKSVGKCRDYNLMLKKGMAEAKIDIIKSEKESKKFYFETVKNDIVVFFVAEGSCLIKIEDKEFSLNKFESIEVEDFDNIYGKIYPENSTVVIAQKIIK